MCLISSPPPPLPLRVGSKYTSDVKHILRFYTFVPARGHKEWSDTLQCVAVADSPAFTVYSRRNRRAGTARWASGSRKPLAAGDTKASSSSSPSTVKVEKCRKSATTATGKRRGAPGANMRSSVGANRRSAADKKHRGHPVAVAPAVAILAAPPAAMKHEPSMRLTDKMATMASSVVSHGSFYAGSSFSPSTVSSAMLSMFLQQHLRQQQHHLLQQPQLQPQTPHAHPRLQSQPHSEPQPPHQHRAGWGG